MTVIFGIEFDDSYGTRRVVRPARYEKRNVYDTETGLVIDVEDHLVQKEKTCHFMDYFEGGYMKSINADNWTLLLEKIANQYELFVEYKYHETGFGGPGSEEISTMIVGYELTNLEYGLSELSDLRNQLNNIFTEGEPKLYIV